MQTIEINEYLKDCGTIEDKVKKLESAKFGWIIPDKRKGIATYTPEVVLDVQCTDVSTEAVPLPRAQSSRTRPALHPGTKAFAQYCA